MERFYPPQKKGLRTPWKPGPLMAKQGDENVPKPRKWYAYWIAMRQEVKDGFLKRPHIVLVFLTFVVLLAKERINFMTFLALGFFTVLLSDHIVQNVKNYRKKRSDQQRDAAEKLAKKAIHAQKESDRRRYFRSLRQPRHTATLKQRASFLEEKENPDEKAA